MTPDEHAAKALQILEHVNDTNLPDEQANLIARAQVHATLATRNTPGADVKHTIHIDTTAPGDVTWNCSCDTTDHVTYRGWDPFAAAAGAATRHIPVGEQLTIYAVSIPNPGEGETVA